MRWVRIGSFLVVVLAAGAVGAWGAVWYTLLRDLPEIDSVADYAPQLTSQVFDRSDQLVGEFFRERRRLTSLDEIPRHAVLAFVAGEDDAFFEHRGVDYRSILRAAWVNLLAGGEIKQGGSTITQQTVKSLLLTPERKLQRKIKELILARRLEQQLTKDEILFLYLNQIYFGHGAYGIGEAAWAYFGKPAAELSVSEAALLAGLPQRPSAYSPNTNPEAADARRRYVLRRMFDEGFIDEPTYTAALDDLPVLSPVPERVAENLAAAAYFTEEVRRVLVERLGNDLVLGGGLRIETTLDADLQRAAVEALREGLRNLDHRQGWRGPLRRVEPGEIPATLQALARENELDGAGPVVALAPGKPLVGVVTEVDTQADRARVGFAPGHAAQVHLEDVSWAREPDPSRRPAAVRSIDSVLQVGSVARFEILAADEKSPGELRAGLHQEPLVQGAVITLQVPDGDVLAMVGGYDFGTSQFNRAVQAYRQPGSAFKPIVYGAALHEGWTPTSIVVDRPVVYSDPESGFTWRPENYGRRFLGSMLLREALARSVNNATIHLTREIGVGDVVEYARLLGIESPLERNLSLALGSSSVSLLELTRAYATYPAGGRRVSPRFIRRVVDREGRVLLENVPLVAGGETATAGSGVPTAQPPAEGDRFTVSARAPEALAIPETEAFLMTDLLRAVVADPRGTGRAARVLGRSVGGKTGTTNEQADAWFVGFSPDLATGVWVGFDRKRVLGRGETGSKAALPIWIDTMGAALSGRPRRDFPVPDGIVFARVDRKTGFLADAQTTDPYFQAYAEGTEPTETADRALAVSESNKMLRIDSF